jgi:hypothetical protein
MPNIGVETAGKTLRSVCNDPSQSYDIFIRFISQLSDFFGQLVKKNAFTLARIFQNIVKNDLAFTPFPLIALTLSVTTQTNSPDHSAIASSVPSRE